MASKSGISSLLQLEKRVDQRFDTMERSFKSLRKDLRILFRFVIGLDQEFRSHRGNGGHHRA